jgi:hypothetical protein
MVWIFETMSLPQTLGEKFSKEKYAEYVTQKHHDQSVLKDKSPGGDWLREPSIVFPLSIL